MTRRTLFVMTAAAAAGSVMNGSVVGEEAAMVALYRAGVPVTLTFETPSEMEFERRVRAHAAFVEAVAEWVETGN